MLWYYFPWLGASAIKNVVKTPWLEKESLSPSSNAPITSSAISPPFYNSIFSMKLTTISISDVKSIFFIWLVVTKSEYPINATRIS
jgi:hypothetical protein